MIKEAPLIDWARLIEHALTKLFLSRDASLNPLESAMEYSVMAGGKRLRPLLTMAACDACGGVPEDAVEYAIATELLHTYSLIHDDLPCMDDDDLRRGKPTNHVVYGEAMAILAGDALHTEAFHQLTRAHCPGLDSETRIRILDEFAQSVGRFGMVGGQVMDLQGEGSPLNLDEITLLHRRKTGALIRFSIRLGALLARADKTVLEGLTRYGEAMGLLFQVVDDLLDCEATSDVLGKTAGKDADQQKSTFPKLMGIEQARQYGQSLLQEALKSLTSIPVKGRLLADLAHYFVSRGY